jgi:hypothetical protein
MAKLTKSEKEELEELRLYKLEMENKGRIKAFARLRALKEYKHDAMVSVRAFHAICDCLEALNEEIEQNDKR